MSAAGDREAVAGLPPGPDLPRSRQTARWIGRPVRFMHSLRDRYGDVFTVHLLGETPWVMVSEPEMVRRVFSADADVLEAGREKRILEPVLGPASVLLSDGEQHMRRRRLLLPAFHNARIGGYEATMRAIAEAEVERWPRGVVGPAAPRMGAIALETIIRFVFGLEGEDGGEGATLRDALERLMAWLMETREALIALGDSAGADRLPVDALREPLGAVDELVFAAIARRRGERDLDRRDDVLSLLLGARGEDGSPISDRELRDELMTLVVAGHETTATSLCWALERLVRCPEALERAVADVDEGGGQYIDAVVRETLRIRPAFMVVPRHVRRPVTLGSLELPAGVAVTPAIPLVHSRPDIYPDPEEFRPERFLERSPGTYAWIPFGGGVRRCLGAGFSLLEMRVVLRALLASALPRLAEPEPERPTRRLLVMAPHRGAEVVLERR